MNATLVAPPLARFVAAQATPVTPYRTTARVVGGVYLAGFVVGIAGSILSANSLTVAIGALLWLLAVAGDAAHGVLMFPVLKQHGERLAIGYLAARIVDAVFIAVMVVFILAASVPASLSAYAIGMAAVGLAGLILNYTLYRARLVPRLLAVWGLIGYAIIFLGMMSELAGSGLGLAASIPGGLWEIFMGVWLIARGFSPSTNPATSASN